MTKDNIIKLAREAGIDAESDTLTRYEGFVEPLTRFATLVVANRQPLTNEEINDIAENYALTNPTTPLHFARAIEAAIKDNNT